MFRFCIVLLFCLRALLAQATDERILFNAKIFTGDPDHPYAEAVAIRADKIIAVGIREDVAKAVSPSAELVDLKGKFLMPGLIDSHCHAVDGGLTLLSASIEEFATTMDQLASVAADAKKSGRGMRGDVLTVSGIPLVYWSKNKELNELFNSPPYTEQAVLLEGMDGHTAWANKTLLRRAGIDREFIANLDSTTRGYYGFDHQNLEPNGFLVDAGVGKVDVAVPEPDKEKLFAAGKAAVGYMHQLGITAWLDAAASDDILATYERLAQAGALNAHVAALPVIEFKKGHPEQQLEKALKQREHFKSVPDVKIPGIKVFADGVAEYPSQTAVFSKPYISTGRNGELLFDPREFAKIVIAADKQGLLVHVHAIGDQAVTEALNGMEAARKANGNSGLPDTITHLQFVRPDDIPRFRQLGVIASFQLYWAIAEPDTIELLKPYIDAAIYEWQYPARSILDAGGMIAGASDWPVSTANVFRAIYQAETRRGPEGVLDAGQRVPRDAMLYAYTRNAARALSEDERIGSMAVGKQADFALLDRDVLTVTAEEVRDTKVLWTIVGGKTVFGSAP
jgi:predicted amidohydrolase YtcJ